MKRTCGLAIAAAAILAGTPANADGGDILVKARGTYHQRLDRFSITLPDSELPADADIENTAGAEFGLALFLTDKIAAEFSLGGAGYQVKDANGSGLVSANLLMSSATIQYHFAPEGKLIRPYVGIGLSHLNLYGEEVEVALRNSAPDPFVAYNSRLTGGFAPVAQAGADIPVNEQLFVSLDVKYTARKTELLIEREVRATEARRLGALVIGLGLGFRF